MIFYQEVRWHRVVWMGDQTNLAMTTASRHPLSPLATPRPASASSFPGALFSLKNVRFGRKPILSHYEWLAPPQLTLVKGKRGPNKPILATITSGAPLFQTLTAADCYICVKCIIAGCDSIKTFSVT